MDKNQIKEIEFTYHKIARHYTTKSLADIKKAISDKLNINYFEVSAYLDGSIIYDTNKDKFKKSNVFNIYDSHKDFINKLLNE